MLMLASIISTFAAEPTVTATPNETINPTVEYLTKQVRDAIEAGTPLMSDTIQVLMSQIQAAGIVLSIYYSLLMFSGLFIIYLGYKFFRGIENNRDPDPVYIMLVALSIIAGALLFFIGTLSIVDSVIMATAPLVWCFQTLLQ